METIGLFSGVLLFSVLCLLPEVKAIYSHIKNKSVKLTFVTKNSKHLVGTGAGDLLALTEFTPL